MQAVDNVFFLLLFDEENIEHLFFALTTIVRSLILSSSMETNLDTFGANKLQSQLSVLQSFHYRIPVIKMFDDVKRYHISNMILKDVLT
jgi:hypothetical protein